MSEKWYSRSFRRNLVDMHIDDWSEEFLAEFDPEKYLECLKTAQIQTAMIYLHSHVGLCYWDSPSGRVHKSFKAENKIRKLIDLCHGEGITVVGYYSLIYNNWAYDAHPDWRILDCNGKGSRETDTRSEFMTGSRYGLVCPNNPDYRAFLHQQFCEMLDIYPMEGIFLDMTFWPSICYCNHCRERFFRETEKDIPRLVDWQDPVWKQFQKNRQAWIGEFAAFCTEQLKSIRPEMTVEHQFSTICHSWHYGIDEKVNLANDYLGGDLYGGPRSHSYISKIMHEGTANQPFEYMTSRCDPRLSVHTTTKSEYTLKLANYLTLAHHGAFLVIDAIDPVGTMDRRVYERIGNVFKESIPYEQYIRGKMVSEAALIMSYDSKYDEAAIPAPDAQASQRHPQLEAQLGISEALTDLRILHTVLPEDKVERIFGKKLVLVTDAPQLRSEELKVLEQYVLEGGNLYISGTTDPRLSEKLLGLKFQGFTQERITYVAPTKAGEPYFCEYNAKYPLSYDGHQFLVENPEGHQVLAKLTIPYTDPNNNACFASIHSNPPGIRTEYPTVILGSCGKGKVLWLGFCPEKNNTVSVREVTKSLIRLLYSPQVLASDAHPVIEMTLFEDEQDYLLHAVNVQEEPPLPVLPFSVELTLPHAISGIIDVGQNKEVEYEQRGDKVSFIVEEPGMFTTIQLKKK